MMPSSSPPKEKTRSTKEKTTAAATNATVGGRSMLCRGNPSKLCVEVAWTVWFVIWSLIMTVIMGTNLGAVWEDVELMVLGAALAVGTYVVPVILKQAVVHVIVPRVFGVRLSAVERAYALKHFASDLFAMFAGVTSLSFGLNLLMTPFFFDVLHMRLGFRVTWTYDRNPIFFYFITVAYFSSYSVLGAMLYRWAAFHGGDGSVARRRRLLPWFHPSALLMRLFASFLLAFLETFLMANPLIDHIFCYDDYVLTLTFGSACYGIGFVFSIWSWTSSVAEDVDVVVLLQEGCKHDDGQQEEAQTHKSSASTLKRRPPHMLMRCGGPWHAVVCALVASLLTAESLTLVRTRTLVRTYTHSYTYTHSFVRMSHRS
jgi:hypothetical protein